ncbi:MAG TPA: CBS domain-containing protein [Anaerolineaceae bacterium]|nr:CBS domain-containing protein [Anaerolineaceae bacterium]HPN53970.1 CBS domain-containing protein [Anaerolineaceae bacterium]
MKNGIVRNWMTSPVITVSPDTSLAEARKIVNERNIRALPIMDGDQLVGIITRRGLLRLDLSSLDEQSWQLKVELKDEKVSDVMTTNPITVSPDWMMPRAARVMLENKITALPVIENDKLVGILTNSDMLRFILGESPSLKKTIPVTNYMTDDVVIVDPDTSLLEAHRLMGIKRIRSLPVINENGDLVGIVTRTDLMSSDPSRLESQNNQQLSLKILTQSVEKVMSKSLITIKSNAPLTEAARLMLENKIHVLPVVDEEKKLKGVITESDLFLMVVQKFY